MAWIQRNTTRMKPYRGRVAPTPTGLLHLGHAQTFGIAHQRARQADGKLVYRTEDLDPQRCKTEFADAALEDLKWLGIDWDEGPEVGGGGGPYFQSQRSDRYQQAVDRLLESGHAYRDYSSSEEVQQEREQAQQEATKGPAAAPGTAIALRDKDLELKDYYRQASRARGTWRATSATAGYSSAARQAGDRAGRRARLGGSSELSGARPSLER